MASSCQRGLILGFAAASPLLIAAAWSWSWTLALAIVGLVHAAVLLPVFMPRLGWLGPVVTRFETEKPEIWLTIDDGPDPVDTPIFLDLLDRYAARVTFFVKGELVVRHPEWAAAMAARGHSVQNHTQTHPAGWFWCYGAAALRRELSACNAAVAQATGATPTLFRAPVGIKSPLLHPQLDRLGMRLVAWSVRGFDGVRGFDPERVAGRLLAKLAPGAIFVMHQGIRDDAGEPLSPRGLERVLEELRARGYSCTIPPPEALR
ncbi:MAG: polysaccharide deacetylase family protein [Nannocystis sp.]|nr:polysaccharide deacetylase family protein [Nannocystis sp.]